MSCRHLGRQTRSLVKPATNRLTASQMAPEVLHRVCHGTSKPSKEQAALFTVQPALLHHYCRHKVDGCDYPGIISEQDKSVRGTYVTGLNAADIVRLDSFEGDQYSRNKVEVELIEGPEKGATKEAETYVWIESGGLVKEEWNYDEFRKEKMHRWADHSEEYAGESTAL